MKTVLTVAVVLIGAVVLPDVALASGAGSDTKLVQGVKGFTDMFTGPIPFYAGIAMFLAAGGALLMGNDFSGVVQRVLVGVMAVGLMMSGPGLMQNFFGARGATIAQAQELAPQSAAAAAHGASSSSNEGRAAARR